MINKIDRVQDLRDPGKKYLGHTSGLSANRLKGRVVHGISDRDVDLLVITIERHQHVLVAKVRIQQIGHIGVDRIVLERE